MALGGMLFVACGAGAQPLDTLIPSTVPMHPKVQAARAAARASGFEVEAAAAAWSPRFGIVADPGVTSGGTQSSSGDVGLRATQLVYDGGKTDAETDRQKARQSAASLRIQVSVEQVAGQIADAYLESIKQQLLVQEAERNVAAHTDLVSRVAEIVNVDRGRRSDLDQANARLEQARVTLATRQAVMKEAVAQLGALSQRRIAALSAPRSAAAFMPASEAAALAQLDTHPAVLAARADVDVAEKAAAVADKWRHPRLDLQGTLGADPVGTANRRYFRVFDVRLVSNWTGFDGGAGQAAANAAREQQQAALDTLESTRRDLSTEVTRQWTAVQTRTDRAAAWDRLVVQLSSVRDNYWEQFKIARRSILDLLNVENEIFQARTSAQTDAAEQEQARYRVLAATARLGEFFNLPPVTAAK
jgi:outer membrane protein TolC